MEVTDEDLGRVVVVSYNGTYQGVLVALTEPNSQIGTQLGLVSGWWRSKWVDVKYISRRYPPRLGFARYWRRFARHVGPSEICAAGLAVAFVLLLAASWIAPKS